MGDKHLKRYLRRINETIRRQREADPFRRCAGCTLFSQCNIQGRCMMPRWRLSEPMEGRDGRD